MGKKVDLSRIRRNETPIQVETTEGIIKEKISGTSFFVTEKRFKAVRLFCVDTKITNDEFFDKCVTTALNNEIPLPLEKISKEENEKKICFLMPQSKKDQFKKWMLTNDVRLKDLCNFYIDNTIPEKYFNL